MTNEKQMIVEWLREEAQRQIDSGYEEGFYAGQGMNFAADEIEANKHKGE